MKLLSHHTLVISIRNLLVTASSVMALGSGLAADVKLSQLPPMGWNSWNAFDKRINEQLFIESTEVLIRSGLADPGYVCVNVDDGWSKRAHRQSVSERNLG